MKSVASYLRVLKWVAWSSGFSPLLYSSYGEMLQRYLCEHRSEERKRSAEERKKEEGRGLPLWRDRAGYLAVD